ncbi:TetR/AcrR family transcriptional regulator [Terricaulis silvestris]|uniref:Copper outer membrane regulator n=1 Tax=Terricaulis silvestris TaxID=2686094 RepID=A0A6I6MRN8_9CAUL|nr:TetR/AcrR family transcriptional regulator [Terricaulis silvestris]QGZ94292.1 Copper outer membrane regulator [Terricaulis silvestris]
MASQARAPDRGVARRQAFLQAAREVFLEQGYEAASVNDVVRRAGGSLATLYAQFGNKEGLFLAVTQDQHERFIRDITPDSVDHLQLEAGLQAIGEHYVRALLMPENLAFFRIVVGEGRKFPEHLQRYIYTGAERVRAVIARFLEARGAQIDDHEMAASYLLELWRSRHHYRALADDAYRVTDRELSEHVGAAVCFFMRAAKPK